MKFKELLQNKLLKTFVKLSISIVCLHVLFQKVNYTDISQNIGRANLAYLFCAALLFALSKLISSIRLQCYFQSIKLAIPFSSNLKLYWLGMFYNLFLPGGIGGDGYKVFYLKNNFREIPVQKNIKALLKDRLNGLMVFLLLLVIIVGFIELPFLKPIYLVIAFVFLIGVLLMVEKLILPEKINAIFLTSFYSLLVHLSQLFSAYFIVLALGIGDYIIPIIFVFQVSTIMAMLPISIGGIGVRELTFIYFAKTFHYNAETSVSMAFLFFIISSVVSLPGICYHFFPEKIKAPTFY